MTTEWFSKNPGEAPTQQQSDGSTATLFNCEAPDVVRLPPELGGQVVKVVRLFYSECPIIHKPNCRQLVLENGLIVSESDRFYWYKPT